jgi:hypothetical protein
MNSNSISTRAVLTVAALLFCCLSLRGEKAPAPAGEAPAATLPPLDRVWTGQDYLAAARVINSADATLPTFADAQGRAFLQREMAPENLVWGKTKGQTAEQDAEDFLKILSGSALIYQHYMTAGSKEIKLHSEIAAQAAFQLRVAQAGIRFMEAYLAAQPKDEKYATRVRGMQQAYKGMNEIFNAAESMLNEKEFFFSDADMTQILQAMAETLPTIKKAFPPGHGAELRKKLIGRKAEFTGEKDTASLQKMIAELGT